MPKLASFSLFAVAAVAIGACENPNNAPQPASPTAAPYGAQPYGAYPPGYPPPQGAPPPGYPPPQQPPPGYGTAGQYQAAPPAPYPTQYPAPAPTPYPQPYAAPAPSPAPSPAPAAPTPGSASSSMSTPGLLALPCQSDVTCGFHHCNTQFGKCAFPCQTAADCIAPNACNMGVCLPVAGPSK